MTNYGENEFYEAYREIILRMRGLSSWPVPPIGKHEISPFDNAMRLSLWNVRKQRMGRMDGTGGFVIEEYDDRWEVVWDPCYTGGQPRRGDPISSTPPYTAPPFNYAINKVAHPWTWGKTGVTRYCSQCATQLEIMDIEKTGGYLGHWVMAHPENLWDPCRYIIYKDINRIPAKYYTRIGVRKPAPQS